MVINDRPELTLTSVFPHFDNFITGSIIDRINAKKGTLLFYVLGGRIFAFNPR